MERLLVIVFDSMLRTYEGDEALAKLDSEGSISVHAETVIEKNANGQVGIKQVGKNFPTRMVSGTLVGALVGLLGGPIGVGAGAIAGAFAGNLGDVHRAGINADFLNEVSDNLTPGKWAIVAEVSEELVTPVDTQMETLGGIVLRTTREHIELEQYARDVADIKAEIAQLKAEQAKSSANQKAKLQAKIEVLIKKLNGKLEAAKQASEGQQNESKAKVEALEKKAAKAKSDAKAKIEKRIAKIKESEQDSAEDFDRWLKGHEP
jgi:uncharacterized membrane protein